MVDKIEVFNERLKELNDSLDVIKKYGFDEEILVAYLVMKLKVSSKKAKQIIDCYNDFYEKTIKQACLAGLK
jgi:hypothetical protein